MEEITTEAQESRAKITNIRCRLLHGQITYEQAQTEAERDVAMHKVVEEVVLLSELLKNAALYYQYATPLEKEQIMKIIFSKLRWDGSTLYYKARNGFKALEKQFIPNCDLIGI
jgi:hypothetical protein